MRRRQFLTGALASFAGASAFSNWPRPISRIAFGSCADQTRAQPIWRAVSAARPDLFIFLGDNVYGDTEDMTVLAEKYARLGCNPEFRSFRLHTPILATWDDHDYGRNDAGTEYPMKRESRELFLDFFGEPYGSIRRRQDGIYTSYLYGIPPFRTQIILLDLRWFRESPARDSSLLGPAQWRWLERQLQIPAELRILGSSIQFAAEGHRWEKWAAFASERNRFMGLIDRLAVDNLYVISGDMHFGELSEIFTPAGRRLYDLTSSGLNRWDPADGPNFRRIELYDRGPNFGLIEMDWASSQVTLSVRDSLGRAVIRHRTPTLTT